MVDAARRRLAAIAQDRQREIAIAPVDRATLFGMDDLHVEHFLVELGEPRRVLGLDGEVTNFRHRVPPRYSGCRGCFLRDARELGCSSQTGQMLEAAMGPPATLVSAHSRGSGNP